MSWSGDLANINLDDTVWLPQPQDLLVDAAQNQVFAQFDPETFAEYTARQSTAPPTLDPQYFNDAYHTSTLRYHEQEVETHQQPSYTCGSRNTSRPERMQFAHQDGASAFIDPKINYGNNLNPLSTFNQAPLGFYPPSAEHTSFSRTHTGQGMSYNGRPQQQPSYMPPPTLPEGYNLYFNTFGSARPRRDGYSQPLTDVFASGSRISGGQRDLSQFPMNLNSQFRPPHTGNIQYSTASDSDFIRQSELSYRHARSTLQTDRTLRNTHSVYSATYQYLPASSSLLARPDERSHQHTQHGAQVEPALDCAHVFGGAHRTQGTADFTFAYESERVYSTATPAGDAAPHPAFAFDQSYAPMADMGDHTALVWKGHNRVDSGLQLSEENMSFPQPSKKRKRVKVQRDSSTADSASQLSDEITSIQSAFEDVKEEEQEEEDESRVKRTGRGYNPFETFVNEVGAQRIRGVNIDFPHAPGVRTSLPQRNMGIVELLTFFPHHTAYPLLMFRALGNGWSTNTMALAVLFARGTLSKKTFGRRAATLCQQLGTAGKHHFHQGKNKFSLLETRSKGQILPVTNYDVSNYAPCGNAIKISPEPAKLLSLAQGIVNWPDDEDAGIVTQVIRHLAQNKNAVEDAEEKTTVDIDDLAAEFGFTGPMEAASQDWDARGRERVMAAVKRAGFTLKDLIPSKTRKIPGQ